MEAGQDHLWLSGESSWVGSRKQPSGNEANSDLPELWQTPSGELGKGWLRQTLKPVASSILLPLAWSPFFLVLTAVPLALPDRTPVDDQMSAAAFFTLSWLLILVPLYLIRSSQPTHVGSFHTLPFDWPSFTFASLVFGLHVLIHPALGWVSYGLFWLTWMRTYVRIREVIMMPAGRWLLPVKSSDWRTSDDLLDGWEVVSEFWTSGPIAHLNLEGKRITLSGASRGDHRFVAMALIGTTGFVHDPFADSSIYIALSEPQVVISGLDWPSALLTS